MPTLTDGLYRPFTALQTNPFKPQPAPDTWLSTWYNNTCRPANAYLGKYIQAGKCDNMAKRRTNNFPQIEFLNFKLHPNDKAAFDRWAKANEEKVGTMLDDLLADNYKISISPDFSNACTIITITCRIEDHPNHNMAFSTRDELWSDALLLALYKHFVVAKGAEWPSENLGNSWG